MSDFAKHEIAMMENWAELRSAKNISLEDVAQRTNITRSKLEALERHDFEKLGTETFALGYLRNYAKMLKEDPEVFIRVYKDAMTSDLPGKFDSSSETQMNPASESDSFLKKIKMLHVLILVIILWLIVMLLLPAPDDETSELTTKQPTISSQDSSGTAALQDPASQSGEIDSSTSEVAVESKEKEVIAVDNGVSESAIDQAATATTDQIPVVPTVNVEANSSEDELMAEDDILVFSFTGDCWLEVTDSTGSVLIAELQRKGDNPRIFGQAPFTVMLGNAREASATLNGKPVPTTPLPGQNTLKLTIPRS